MPRNRSARLAVLGAGVPRSRPVSYSSRKASAVRRRIVAGVLVLLSIALITVYFRESAGGGLHQVQSAGATVLRPFEVAADRVSRPFRDAYGYFAGLVHAKSENNQLRREVEKLRQSQTLNVAAASENADLRKKLNFVNSPSYPRGYDYVTAPIIAQSPAAYEQQVTIAAGSSSGIRVFDPVVTGEGLVGTVVRVAHNVSLVALLTDDTTSVSSIDANTRAQGVVKAGASFDHVGKDQEVKSGDLLVTAGWKTGSLASIYPPKIPIGRVTSVGQNEVDLYKHVQVQPFVNFETLGSLVVLMKHR
ncbi:MAG: rod shape-determining protein MreC [Actinobacteria bacterium]|nr:MAG: rod shape-determining protein MreC [Actinomycetota bacterium]